MPCHKSVGTPDYMARFVFTIFALHNDRNRLLVLRCMMAITRDAMHVLPR